jgi:hypothetical protein
MRHWRFCGFVILGVLLLGSWLPAVTAQPDTKKLDTQGIEKDKSTPPTAREAGSASAPAKGPAASEKKDAAQFDLHAVAADLASGGLWGCIFLAIVFGALGGMVYELVFLDGTIKLPHARKPDDPVSNPAVKFSPADKLYDLGFLARVFIGGLAAVAVLFIANPDSGIRFLAISVIAGSTGMALFQTAQARMQAAASTMRLATASEVLADIHARADDSHSQVMSVASTAADPNSAAQHLKTAAMLQDIRALAKAGLRAAGKDQG